MKVGTKLGSPKAVKMPNIISLDSTELPDIKNWKPGQRYRVTLELEQVNMSLGGDYYDGSGDKNMVRASFKVVSAKPQYGGGPTRGSKPDKSATMNAIRRRAR